MGENIRSNSVLYVLAAQIGRTITNLSFDDDIDGLAGEEELAKLAKRFSRQSLHILRHGDQCREDQVDEKKNTTSGINTK